MRSFLWTSDIHLDRMDARDFRAFMDWVAAQDAGALVISGDIAEADSFAGFLRKLSEELPIPIYFVLGNHDFWGSSFAEVRAIARELTREFRNLRWLTESEPIAMDPETCMMGHDGWSDGRLGSFVPGEPVPRDFMKIRDLACLPRTEYIAALNVLGDAAAAQVRRTLTDLAARFQRVYLVTHVPPFQEACRDNSGRICNDRKLPFYTCKALGDALLDVMGKRPACELTVLCGHSHDECHVRPAANIRVLVRNAGYGNWYTPTMLTSDGSIVTD
jgi:hypothetical protein